MKILQISAWRNSEQAGDYSWNEWFDIGDMDKATFETIGNSTRKILKWLRDENYLSDQSKGKLYVEDDECNLVIVKRSNHCPLIAIEYGPEYI